jgi:dienelactone hydrolase
MMGVHSGRLAAMVLAVLGVAVALGGCAAHAATPMLTVTPAVSGMDSPLTVEASGLPAGQSATISVDSTDAKHIGWSGRAVFVANSHGGVDSRTSAAKSGSYTGVDGMGLVTFMRPTTAVAVNSEYWWATGQVRFRFELHVSGRVVATSTVTRTAIAAFTVTSSLTLQRDGLIGEFTASKNTSALSPAVLMIGGSEGGNSGPLVGARLAAHGIRSLSVAYFGETGLPAQLAKIPLEYFAKALTWLRSQPGVDPHHVWVMGGSRGSEAAELLGVHYPNLVNGVVVNAPSSVAICSYPNCNGPVWTLNGTAIPYTKQFNNTTPADDPAAVIPVDRIAGPLLAVCGTADHTWSSCDYGNSIMTQLTHAHDSYPHQLLSYPGAGHLGEVLAYEPGSATAINTESTAIADDQAQAAAWPKEVAFILDNSR